MHKDLQRAAVMRDPTMAAANIAAAQSDAMRTAAANENGAMAGFMGMGMAGAMGGLNAQQLYQVGQPAGPAPSPAPVPKRGGMRVISPSSLGRRSRKGLGNSPRGRE